MYELANDINGDPVDVPDAARYWRLRRHLGGRGASVVVTNDENAALLLPISASYAEFHDAIRGAAGKYTLYPCDDQGRAIKGAPVAHHFISEAPRNSNAAGAQAGAGDAMVQLIALLRDTVEANTTMCKEIVGKYGATLTSNAELIRAVDGAGVSTRQPAAATVDVDDDQEGDDDEEYEPTVAELAIKQASDAFLMWMKLRSEGKEPGPTPAPVAEAKPAPAPDKPRMDRQAKPEAKPEPTAASPGVPTAAQMAHLLVVKSKLEPREARVVEAAIGKMPAAERGQWIAELCARSVDDAVALVRDVIQETKAADEAKEGAS